MPHCSSCNNPSLSVSDWIGTFIRDGDVDTVRKVTHHFVGFIVSEHMNKDRLVDNVRICSMNHISCDLHENPTKGKFLDSSLSHYENNMLRTDVFFRTYNNNREFYLRMLKNPNVVVKLFNKDDVKALEYNMTSTASTKELHATVDSVKVVDRY